MEGSIRTSVMVITPDMAKEMLSRNHPNNRRINKRIVDSYSEAMKSGQWHLTHQGIAFKNNMLIDGQHRLEAIVSAGVPVKMSVSFYEGDSGTNSILYLDTCRVRSASDALKMVTGDSKYGCGYIGALKYFISTYVDKVSIFSAKKIRTERVADFERENPEIAEILLYYSTMKCNTAMGGKSFSAAVTSALTACVLSGMDRKMADSFASCYVKGELMSEDRYKHAIRLRSELSALGDGGRGCIELIETRIYSYFQGNLSLAKTGRKYENAYYKYANNKQLEMRCLSL